MNTWLRIGRGRETDKQKETLHALIRTAPDASVTAELRARWDPMNVCVGDQHWVIYADGTARPGIWRRKL